MTVGAVLAITPVSTPVLRGGKQKMLVIEAGENQGLCHRNCGLPNSKDYRFYGA
jgi:hypothetical protein